MTFWITQLLNGISFGMLLFLLAAGLSLIYGLMRILNLAHGSYYLLGAYVGLTVVRITGSFVLAAVAGTAAVVPLSPTGTSPGPGRLCLAIVKDTSSTV